MKIGIDLGTTNTVVCELRGGNYNYIDIEGNGSNVMPSVIRYNAGNEAITVGSRAKNVMEVYPEECISGSKVFLGTDKTWVIGGRSFRAEDVAQLILKEIYSVLTASCEPGKEIIATISVPACFSQTQVRLTMQAAENCGFKVRNMVQEPIAAAKAEGISLGRNGNLFVVDIGGGTLDITAVSNSTNTFGNNVTEVIAVGGDSKLGGNDFDAHILSNIILTRVYAACGNDVERSYDRRTVMRTRQYLARTAEEIKCHFQREERNYCEELFDIYGQDIQLDISYAEYKMAVAAVIARAEKAIKEVIDDLDSRCNIKPNAFTKVILAGGMCKERQIRDILKKYFDDDRIHVTGTPMTSIAEGAARYVNERNINIPAMLSVDIGVMVGTDNGQEFHPIFNKNTPINGKVSKTEHFGNRSADATVLRIEVRERKDSSDSGTICDAFDIEVEAAPPRESKIEIQFELTSSRELQMVAKYLGHDLVVNRCAEISNN